jgi:DNA-binding CsgD family transcriptional regulator
MSKQDAKAALRTLTVSECRVLYWRCKGLSCEEVAKKLVVTERTVYFHLANIYGKLGLQDQDQYERLRILTQLYCPVLLEEVKNPDTDCGKLRKPDEEPIPEPPRETLALVLIDDTKRLVPMQASPTALRPHGNPPQRSVIIIPPRQPRQAQQPWVLWLLVGIVLGASAVFIALGRTTSRPGTGVDTSGASTSGDALHVQTPAAVTAPTNIPVPTDRPTVQQAQTEVPTQSPVDTPKPTSTGIPTTTLAPSRTPIPRPTMALPFEDNFENGPRKEWQPQFGVWRMVNGRYKTDRSDTMSLTLAGDEAWTDYAVDVDVYENGLTGFPVRVIVRASEGRYIAFETHCCLADLILVGLGADRMIAHSDQAGIISHIDQWNTNHLRVEVRGDIYAAYANGKLMLRAQDSTLSQGRVGLGAKTMFNDKPLFDNFKVTPLN